MAAAIRTPDQRLRVFVSSTLGELAAERVAVRAAVERLRLTPVMFELGARPHPPRDLYRAYLEQSDVFVGIYGESYGWVSPELEVSGLEDEYLLSRGKPALLYVKEPAPDREGRLVELIGRIEADARVSYKTFSSAEQLAEQVESDLALLLAERFARPLELPGGTVTLLFTDVEGSTRMLQRLGAGYREVLEDHRRLLREAFAAQGGHELGTEGDSFFVAFRRARDGVAAAAAAQRALSEHSWPEGARLRVRMGLHSGEPDVGGENYVGLGVHRAARVSAAGHGGQVLLSNATRELVEDDLPAGVALRELGTYRLKDLDRPERIFQLVVDGLPDSFAPLKGERVAEGLSRGKKVLLLVAGLAAAAAAVAVPLLATGGAPGVTVAANSVGVIDPKSNHVVASIPVGTRPGDVAYGSGSIWVANLGDNTVSRVDPKADQVLRSVSVPASPSGLAAGEGGVWVASSDGSVRRIDPAFDSVTTARLPAKTYIVGFVLPSPVAVGAGSVWVASNTQVSQIDPHRGKVVSSTGSGFSPTGIAIAFGSVWVAENTENEVTRLPLGGGTSRTTPVGQGPAGIATGYGGVWVANSTDGTVTRIDPVSGAAQATIRVGRDPDGIAVGAGSVWVANAGDGTVTRIDPKTSRVVKAIHVGNSPTGVTVADGRVWVTVQQSAGALLSSAGPGGVARVPIQNDSNFLNLDPALAGSGDVDQILYATCAKLLDYPDKPGAAGQQLVPEVARSLPTITDGGRTYTFTIRPGYRFSPPSNQPVTAQTFKDVIERTFSPRELTSIPPFSIGDLVGASAYEHGRAAHISGVVARGDKLIIQLTRPAGDLEARLATPNLCAVPTSTPTSRQGIPAIPMAGPYYIALYSPGKLLVLKRNPNYHGPRPHRVAAIEYEIGPDGSQAAQQVETGAADYFSDQLYTAAFPPSLIPSLRARYGPDSPATRAGHQRFFENPNASSGSFGIALNTSRPLFRNVDVRKAVAYAIDRTALAANDVTNFGGTRVTDQLLVPGTPGYRPANVYPPRPDLATARRLARGHGGVAVLWLPPGEEQLAAEIERDLAPIGIQVVTKTFPVGAWLAAIRTAGAAYDMTTGVGGFADADPESVLDSFDPANIPDGNFSRFDDPAFTRRLHAAERLTGPARYRAYAALDVQLTRDAVPFVTYEYTLNGDFFSARIGCQTYQPIYGIDLAALCVRQRR